MVSVRPTVNYMMNLGKICRTYSTVSVDLGLLNNDYYIDNDDYQ